MYTLLLFSFTRGERTVPDLCRSVFHYYFFSSIPHNVCGGRGNNRELAGDDQYTHNIRERVSGVFFMGCQVPTKCNINAQMPLQCQVLKNKKVALF